MIFPIMMMVPQCIPRHSHNTGPITLAQQFSIWFPKDCWNQSTRHVRSIDVGISHAGLIPGSSPTYPTAIMRNLPEKTDWYIVQDSGSQRPTRFCDPGMPYQCVSIGVSSKLPTVNKCYRPIGGKGIRDRLSFSCKGRWTSMKGTKRFGPLQYIATASC